MATYYANFQEKLLNNLMLTLRNDPFVNGLVTNRIYTQHISTIENPLFPAITVTRAGLGSDTGIVEIDTAFVLFDVWSKRDAVELWKIYAFKDPITFVNQGIKALFNNKSQDYPELSVEIMNEVYVQDNLYQAWDKTFHLAARYRVLSAAKAA